MLNNRSSSLELPQVNQTLDGFQIVEVLGQGGMGVVYKVWKAGVFYALKVILDPSLDELVRFEREAVSLAATRHPNIVAIHSFQKEGPWPYILFEYIEGTDLSAHITPGEPWSLEECMKVLDPLSGALGKIHEKGIIHRDLKPANIMIRASDGRPLLTDFGIAKNQNMETLTRDGDLIGTISYMSPEQLQGLKITPRTDIWALGVILYELLSGGQHPFTGIGSIGIAQKIMLKDMLPLKSHAPDSPEALRLVFAKCLAKDPSNRYQDVRSMIADCYRIINKDSEIALRLAELNRKLSAIKKFTAFVLLLFVVGTIGIYLRGQAWEAAKVNDMIALESNFKRHAANTPVDFARHLESQSETLPCCEKLTGLFRKFQALDRELEEARSTSFTMKSPRKISPRLDKVRSTIELLSTIHKCEALPAPRGNGSGAEHEIAQGYLSFKRGQFSRAFDEFENIESKSFSWRNALSYAQALCAYRNGRFEEAASYLKDLDELSDASQLVSRLRARAYLHQSVEALFQHSPIADIVVKLRASLEQEAVSEKASFARWDEFFKESFEALIRSKPERIERVFLRHRSLTYHFPKLASLVLSQAALLECLKTSMKDRNEARAFMYCVKLKRLDAAFSPPKSLGLVFDSSRRLDFNKLNDDLTASMVLGKRKHPALFEIVLEAMRHGVYLELYEGYDIRAKLVRSGAISRALVGQSTDPFLRFWHAYTRPDGELERYLEDYQYVIAHPKIPDFCRAIALEMKVFKHVEREKLTMNKLSTEVFRQCEKDLKEVMALPHPQPYVAYWHLHLLILLGQHRKEELEAVAERALQILGKYKELLDEHMRRQREGLRFDGRPEGCPLVRITQEKYKTLKCYYHERRGLLLHRLGLPEKALPDLLAYSEKGIAPSSFAALINCCERSGDPKMLAKVEDLIRQKVTNHLVTKANRDKFKLLLEYVKKLREKE